MKKYGNIFIVILFLFSTAGPFDSKIHGLEANSFSNPVVDVEASLARLIAEEDTNNDRKITVDDTCPESHGRGDRRFRLNAQDGKTYEVFGTYHLSNLLQELKTAQEEGQRRIHFEWIFENPVHRITRLIHEKYWNGLTRRIDGPNLKKILSDDKYASAGYHYLYVPATDPAAFNYFSEVAKQQPDLKLKAVRLPEKITPDFTARELTGKHGLLTLKLVPEGNGTYSGTPFVVPGGRFNEMYGWDSYFEVLGLIRDGYVPLAKAMVDNFVYQIKHYGKILNANRSYYLTRSQPPFLTAMALAVYAWLPEDATSKRWLENVFRYAIKEYYEVWMNADRLTETGLSRYFGSGEGPPPEVEPGHFNAIFQQYADASGMDRGVFEKKYRAGKIRSPELDGFFIHDRAVRESGHDTTYRWTWDGDRCADFVTVDLNSLLYKTEIDIAETLDKEFGGKLTMNGGSIEKGSTWRLRAEKRKRLMNEFLWDEEKGMFFDYDYRVKKNRHIYVSATAFYPLWAGLATPDQALSIINHALPELEMPGGISASSEDSLNQLRIRRSERQWDYPNGWAPHQMLAWQGMINYGYDSIAHRLIYRWLFTITRNAADYNGTIPEKLDVVKRSHRVFTEYGNVGTKFSYITREGFGWMNASYQVGLDLLPGNMRDYLEQLIPPEWLF